MKREITIPDIAENVDTGIIAGILVDTGDTIEADQSLVEVETDKATTDIPSPFDGVIDEIKVNEGDEVKVGQVIMLVETKNGEGTKEDEEKTDKTEPQKSPKNTEEQTTKEKDKKQPSNDAEDNKKEQPKAVKDEQKMPEDIPASPSIRRQAREMGIDLAQIEGSGPGNRITREDLEKAQGKDTQETTTKEDPLPDFSQWGTVSTEPMSNIRKITAQNMQKAWQTIPQVTQFDEADITELEIFRKNIQQKAGDNAKITVTALLLKITAYALQKFPRFNASLNYEKQEIIYKHYYNIGVAVDTPNGLLVPVLRDVHKKSVIEISKELGELAEKARNKKLATEDMQGGNFTLSNLGGIGGTSFTPIVYAPQVAILGVARSKYQPVYNSEKDDFEKRRVIPLSLSYDHRVIDGADGARFLKWVCNVVENPYALLI